MFKKTLLAAALATAAFSSTAAVTVSTSSGNADKAFDVSSQGLPLTKAVTLSDVTVALSSAEASALATGAKIKLTFSGAFVQTAPSAVPVYADVTPTGGTANDNTFAGDKDTDSIVNGTVGNFTGSAYTATSTTLTIPFNAVPVDGDSDDGVSLGDLISGDTITFSNVPLLLDSSAVGSKVTVTAQVLSSTGAAVAGTASADTKVMDVVNQWSAGLVNDIALSSPSARKLDAQIDVGDSRETFVGGVSVDTLTFSANEVTSTVQATETGLTLKLIGDFTGVKSVTSSTNSAAAVTWTINSSETEATYTFTAATTTTVSSALDNETVVSVNTNTKDADKVSLEVRDWEFDADVTYTDSEAQTGAIELLGAVDAGSWVLNGVTDSTDYVPFGPNTALIYQATSTFNEDALLSLSYLNETTGKMVALNDIGTVKANSVTKLGKLISDAIIADSGMTSGKTKITVTVNAPSGKVSFFKGFKDTSDKDRLGL